jgi:hypothetical protein
MALFNITIEKVIVKDNNEEVIKLLKEIKCLLLNDGNDGDAELRQDIMNKLNSAIADIKTTVS